eukprot:GHUV01010928.1.p1 GENE.GHUV01010928.1~~GHUV01010928.1.p1  ORF type:complete len:489 (+),score=184.09 GHUV01010928.1:311-1777(+)
MAAFGVQVAVWSVAVAACAFKLHHTGYRLLRSQEDIEAQLGVYDAAADSPDTFVVYAGRLLFFATALAWLVVIVQSLISAVRRYRHKPAAVPALKPLSAEEIEQQQKSQQSTLSTAAATHQRSLGPQQPSDALQRPKQQPQQQRSGRERELEERRRRVAEEKQRQLDEAAAARKQQLEREEAERKARAAAAAAQAAELHRQQQEQQQRARAAEQQQWELWEQAVLQHYRRSHGEAGNTSGSGTTTGQPPALSSAAAPSGVPARDQIAAAATTAQQYRQTRQQQDAEYQVSLAADQQRQQHKRQQHNLKHLKQLLQQKYAAAGRATDESDGLSDVGLTVRVKLPDGGSAVRTFACDQALPDVYEWVFSLDSMPCLAPGSWSLATTYPKQKLLPATGIWSPDGYSSNGVELQQYIHELQMGAAGAGGSWWGLTVRQITGEELVVLVRDDSTVLDLKEKLQLQTGTASCCSSPFVTTLCMCGLRHCLWQQQ